MEKLNKPALVENLGNVVIIGHVEDAKSYEVRIIDSNGRVIAGPHVLSVKSSVSPGDKVSVDLVDLKRARGYKFRKGVEYIIEIIAKGKGFLASDPLQQPLELNTEDDADVLNRLIPGSLSWWVITGAIAGALVLALTLVALGWYVCRSKCVSTPVNDGEIAEARSAASKASNELVQAKAEVESLREETNRLGKATAEPQTSTTPAAASTPPPAKTSSKGTKAPAKSQVASNAPPAATNADSGKQSVSQLEGTNVPPRVRIGKSKVEGVDGSHNVIGNFNRVDNSVTYHIGTQIIRPGETCPTNKWEELETRIISLEKFPIMVYTNIIIYSNETVRFDIPPGYKLVPVEPEYFVVKHGKDCGWWPYDPDRKLTCTHCNHDHHRCTVALRPDVDVTAAPFYFRFRLKPKSECEVCAQIRLQEEALRKQGLANPAPVR
jgi:hypothetical protein